MRLIKLLLLALLAVVALLGGMFIAALVAAGVAMAWAVRRFLVKPRTAQLTSPARPSRPPTTATFDVIDVAATEVSATSRQP